MCAVFVSVCVVVVFGNLSKWYRKILVNSLKKNVKIIIFILFNYSKCLY